MIRGTSRGSLRTSTISPASTATSAPAPIAIPTSAVTAAGASFTPSPTMATRFPERLSFSIFADFSSGNTSARTASIPSSVATESATARASPVINDNLHAATVQELDRFARFWPDNVGQSENCDRFAAFDEIDRRLATFICLPEEFLQLFGHGDARGLDQRRPSHSQFAPFEAGLHALAGDGLEAVCRRDVEPALFSASDDSFGDGM